MPQGANKGGTMAGLGDSRPGLASGSGRQVEFQARFQVNDVLNDTYELTEVLGVGGMGQVFAAHDRELNRQVAVKVCWEGLAEDILVREARVMAAFRHPGLLAVHAMGCHKGVRYVVMERLYGQSLADHLAARDNKFTLRESMHVLRGTAAALCELHRAQLVHRDLKPENIMLVPPNRIVVLDFGIVQQEREVDGKGSITGSPYYMAPETLTRTARRGEAHLVDVYALGIIAFRLLTGVQPFEAATIEDIIVKQVREPPPSLLDGAPDAPPELVELVADMLQKDPDLRPHSIDVVSERLAHVREDYAERRAAPIDVLIVEDDPDCLELTQKSVERAAPGVRVRTATDGEMALRLFRANPPDLLLLDVDLPKMNGLELCIALSTTRAAHNARIVVVSGHVSDGDADLFRSFGVGDIIAKDTGFVEQVASLVSRVARR